MNQSARGTFRFSAFTLIELLVSVVLMGILALLLLMALAQVKGKARRIQCVNNLRQLELALLSCVNENNAYPLFVDPPNGSWVSQLQHTELAVGTTHVNSIQYLSEGVWKCPAARKPSNWPSQKGYFSYGYNCYGLTRPADTLSLGLGGHNLWDPPRNAAATHLPAPAVRESEVARPSDMLAIGDDFYGGGGVIRDGGLVFGRTRGLQDFYDSTKRSYARHQGKANAGFCDGHVESPALSFLFEATTDEALQGWNRDHQPHRERL